MLDARLIFDGSEATQSWTPKAIPKIPSASTVSVAFTASFAHSVELQELALVVFPHIENDWLPPALISTLQHPKLQAVRGGHVRKPSIGVILLGLIPFAMCFSVSLWDRVYLMVLGTAFNLFWLVRGILLHHKL